MPLIDGLLQELEQEAQTTRRVLERVPDNKLSWRPHPKARTLGELALHVATVPGGVAALVSSPSPAQAPDFKDPAPKSASELVPALDQSIANVRKLLGSMDDSTLMATWRLMSGDRELFAVPRAGAPQVGHAEPLVSPSWTAHGVSPGTRRSDSFDLRTER